MRFLVDHFARLPALVAFVQADWLQVSRGGAPTPFTFWQPACALARPDEPWHRWMPLGKRHNCWPPGYMRRSASYWHKRSSAASQAQVEACWHELLRVFGQPVDPAAQLTLTFYPYQNFLASRSQLHTHSYSDYRLAYDRLVINGSCFDPPAQRDAHGLPAHDSVPFHKETVAKGMEHLMHVIFGGRPLDAGEGDATSYVRLPANRSCTDAARSPSPACTHGL